MANSTPTLIVEGPVQSVTSGPLEQTARSRRKWSTEENRDVLLCFFQAKNEGKYFGKRMNQLWLEKYPDINVGEKRLTLQKNIILKKKWFTDVELEEIKNIAIQGTREVSEEHQDLNNVVENQHQCLIHNIENVSISDANCNDNTDIYIQIDNMQHNAQEDAINDLSEYQMEIRHRIIEKMSDTNQRKRLPKLKYSTKLSQITAEFNKAVSTIPTNCITETNELLYATAFVVTEELGYKINERKKIDGKDPPWKRRIQNKINNMRKDISRLKELETQNLKNKKLVDELTKKHQLSKKNIKQVVEELKQHTRALSKKIERYENRVKQYHQNKLFQTNQKDLYKELNKTITATKQKQNPTNKR